MIVNTVYEKLKTLKPICDHDGITILGLFGSYARGDYTNHSDIDILYEIKDINTFKTKYKGFSAFTKLAEVKEFLRKEFGKNIDFVDKATLNEIGQKFILSELKYV